MDFRTFRLNLRYLSANHHRRHVFSPTSRSQVVDLVIFSHDSNSPSSQRILSLLQSRIKPTEEVKASNQDVTSSPASEYLRSASSAQASSSAPYELEVVDRQKATPDQWNTIGSYLSKSKRSQVEQLEDEEGAILVDWDDGQALQTEDAVKNLLNQLTREKDTSKAGSWWQRWTS